MIDYSTRRWIMSRNIKIDIEEFKIHLLEVLKNEFPNIMERILLYLTNRFDILVTDYKSKINTVDARNSVKIDNPTNNIENYLIADEDGKILIKNKKYKINPEVFKVIHFVTAREIVNTLKDIVAKEYANVYVENTELKARKAVAEIVNSILPAYWDMIHKLNRFDKKYRDMEKTNLIENNVINHPSKTDYIYGCIHTSIIIKYADYLSNVETRKAEESKNV